MKKFLYIFVVITQIIIIAVLVQDLFRKKDGAVHISPIHKQSLKFTKTETLHYFYEPKPNTSIKPESPFKGVEDVRYTINADGLNQIENYAEKKPSNTFRIMAIGDSLTFGSYVNTKANYPSQLQHLLAEKMSCPKKTNVEVLNLGVHGYDIQYTVERFNIRGKKYNPDLIIWLFVPDDFRRINELLLPKMEKHQKEEKNSGKYITNTSGGIYYDSAKKAKDEVIQQLGGEDGVLSLQKTYLEDINRYYSGKMVLASLGKNDSLYNNFLKDFALKRKDTFFYDLPTIYQRDNALLPDGHPSETGYTFIAQDILEYLLDQNLIPCSL